MPSCVAVTLGGALHAPLTLCVRAREEHLLSLKAHFTCLSPHFTAHPPAQPHPHNHHNPTNTIQAQRSSPPPTCRTARSALSHHLSRAHTMAASACSGAHTMAASVNSCTLVKRARSDSRDSTPTVPTAAGPSLPRRGTPHPRKKRRVIRVETRRKDSIVAAAHQWGLSVKNAATLCKNFEEAQTS